MAELEERSYAAEVAGRMRFAAQLANYRCERWRSSDWPSKWRRASGGCSRRT